MAINKISSPTAYTPGYLVGQTDYTQQNLKTEAALGLGKCIFSDPSGNHSSLSVSLKQGAFIYYAGSTYQVQDEDYEISITSTIDHYIILTGTDTLTSSFVATKTGYTWNAAYNGMYSGNNLILPFYITSDYSTYGYIEEYIDKATMQIRVSYYTGDVNTEGSNINTGGAWVETEGGAIITDAGPIDTGGGYIDSDGGSIYTRDGNFVNGTGHFLPCTSPTIGYFSTPISSTSYLPIGFYVIQNPSTYPLEVYHSSWNTITTEDWITLESNGSNVRSVNGSASFAASKSYIKY